MRLFTHAFPGTACSSIVVLLMLLTLSACAPKEKQPAGLKEFAEVFRVANEADTIKPMLALYHLEGANELMLKRLKGALHSEHGLPITDITFEPLSGAPEETICFECDGVAYGPSHTPEYRMSVYHAVEDGFTSRYTIGRIDNGEWKILCSKPLPEPSL